MIRVIILAFFSLIFLACNSASEQRPSTKYEEKKTSMEEIERDSPLKFLKITASHRTNLINQTVVEGEVTNKATLVSYKNIEVQVTFLDKDGSVIEKQKQTLDEVVKAGTTNSFKIKPGHIKGATSVSTTIISAVADK